MKTIDLNCDMGESFGAYTIGLDEEVIKFITSANIACGWHAGDPQVMNKTVALAAENGVGVGAHPGYPDLIGFGRRPMACSPEELQQYLVYQIGALKAFCTVHGVPMRHVKPHGALYLTAVEIEETARAVAKAIVSVDPDLMFVALAGAKGELMRRVGKEMGLKVVYEAFPDRAYTPEGTLLSRKLPGALVSDPDEVARRALSMAVDGTVVAVDGSTIALEAQTLCVHGDGPTAVDLVKQIRTTLKDNDVVLKPMEAMLPDAGYTLRQNSIQECRRPGLLAEYGSGIAPEINARVRAMAKMLENNPAEGIEEIIPTYRSLLLVYNPLEISQEALKQTLLDMEKDLDTQDLPEPKVVEIPVCYGGDYGMDMATVAESHGLSEDQVIDIHTQPDYLIYMVGFTPGFPFLGGLDKRLHTPRLSTPRMKVPKGSVGIANNQTGIYPVTSPGGWQIIGRTPLTLFSPDRPDPFLYKAGDAIRFKSISSAEFQQLASGEAN